MSMAFGTPAHNQRTWFKTLVKTLFQSTLTERLFVWRGRVDQKVAALTFDDGPHPVYTRQCLHVLQKHKTKATFFLIGKNVEAYPEIVRQIQAGGHAIGIHTYSHPPLYRMSYPRVQEELKMTQNLLMDLTGEMITIYRPPRGQISIKLLCYTALLKFTTVLWTITFSDHQSVGAKHLSSQIERTIFRAGDIILLHDNNPHSLEVLPVLIQRLQHEEFEFVTIQELLGQRRRSISPSLYQI